MKTRILILTTILLLFISYTWITSRHVRVVEKETTTDTRGYIRGDILIYKNNLLRYPLSGERADTLAIVTEVGVNGKVVLKYSKHKLIQR